MLRRLQNAKCKMQIADVPRGCGVGRPAHSDTRAQRGFDVADLIEAGYSQFDAAS
jgi:hypothetical protein